jgi:hypothetical protein
MFLFYFSSTVGMIKLRRLKVMWPCNLRREHVMYIWNFDGGIQKKATIGTSKMKLGR